MKRRRKSGRPGRLARLDQRVTPGLARAMRGIGRTVRRAGRATGPPGRVLARLVRRNPTVTTAVVTVIAATVLILATGGDQHHAVAPAPPSPDAVLPGDLLGPATGQQVSTYLAVAQTRRNQLDVTAAPEVTAVVDFHGYLTPSATNSVLAAQPQVDVIQAFVAPAVGGAIHPISLSPGTDLSTELARLHADAHNVVVSYRKREAAARKGLSTRDKQIRAAYAEAQAESAGLGATVGCVFAVVVTAPPASLERLSRAPDVRVLDPAPAEIPRQNLMIVPLEPQVTGTMSALTFAGE